MGSSLQEQLLKAGLVNKQKASQARKQVAGKRRQQAAPDQARLDAEQAQARQRERDARLNRERQEEAEKKAARAQIKQLIETHRVARDDGDTPYRFQHGSRIKSIYVTATQHASLVQGALVIATLGGRYELVPAETGEKICQRDPRRVISRQPDAPAAAATGDADDPYAAYQVPDDLIW